MTSGPLQILGLSGSLRQGSYNTALLRTLGQLMPHDATFALYDYGDVPLYNDDVEPPDGVARLKQAISDADAVLIATPEYNYSVPGVLKNAIDWASRPAYRSPFRHKPAAVASAAKSFVGGARAQAHLKLILAGMGAPVFPWPELLVGSAHQRVTDGVISDEATLGFCQQFVDGFVAWVAQQRRLAT